MSNTDQRRDLFAEAAAQRQAVRDVVLMQPAPVPLPMRVFPLEGLDHAAVFTPQEKLAAGALFVCCRGIDYHAQVFLNGALFGTYKGFFAPFEFEATAVARLGDSMRV